MLPAFGEYMSVEFIHCSRAQLSEAQLSTFLGRTIGPMGYFLFYGLWNIFDLHKKITIFGDKLKSCCGNM